MPKHKNFADLSRSQKYRRLKKMDLQKNTSATIHEEINELEQLDCVSYVNLNANLIGETVGASQLEATVTDQQNVMTLSNSHQLIPQLEPTLYDFESVNRYVSCNTNHVPNFQQDLVLWAVECNVPQATITKLLYVCKKNGMDGHPVSARALLRTPRYNAIKKSASGSYLHYGLKKALQDQLRMRKLRTENFNTQININIDGLPLAKSSKSQLWPILGQIIENDRHPFVIGAFHGSSKPHSASELLEEFVNECKILQWEGLEFEDKRYTITIRAIICDAPARSFVTCVKGHAGYFGCAKCLQEGTYRNCRMLFLDEDSPLRTDSGFANRITEDHHTGTSPFENIPIPMVSSFPLDYMHLVCLGVVKKMFGLWLRGYQTTRLSARSIKKFSQDLVSVGEWIPVEFCRKPRGLDELDRWKATEFRLFLLYLSPVMLAEYLPNENVLHICVLQCAISILCHPTDCTYNNDYAKNLLVHFVKTMKLLYGNETIIYNVHNLIHLADDAKLFSRLDSISAFPFENHMQAIKKSLRKADRPLAQLYNRIVEKNMVVMPQSQENALKEPVLLRRRSRIVPPGSHSYTNIKFTHFELSCIDKANNCCYLKDGSIIRIKDIGYQNQEKVCLGHILCNSERLATYPCDSRMLGIHVGNQWSDVKLININKIVGKAVKLPYKGRFCFLPLLHTILK